MKKLASTLILALAVVFGSQSAMASTLDNKDLAFAFGAESVDPGILMLSEREMSETEGNLAPLLALLRAGGSRLVSWGRSLFEPTPRNAAYGATLGSISYGAPAIRNDNWTSVGQLSAAIGGATGGLFRNGWYAGPVGAGVGGLTGNEVNNFLSFPPNQNNSRNFGRDVGFYCGACRNFQR